MKRSAIVLILAMLLALLSVGLVGCDTGLTPSSSTFTISVSGTAGTAFSGSYLVTTSDGGSNSKSVDGTVPTSYTVTGTMVSVTFQKQTGDTSTLKVEIKKGGTVVKEADTTAAYGVVTAASS